MKVKLEAKGMRDVEKALEDVFSKQAHVKREVFSSSLEIQTKAKANLKDKEKIDTGNLRNSVQVEMKKAGFEGEIGPEAPYGPHVEFGTRKHFPPPDALEAWARHHGFESAWPICKIIARRGLPATFFLTNAFLSVEGPFFDRLKGIFKK